MQQSPRILQVERKVKHIVDNAGSSSLFYLVLPMYGWVVGVHDPMTLTLSAVVTVLALLRFLWSKLHRNIRPQTYLTALYLIASALALSASLLAAFSLRAGSEHGELLFTTIFVATMTSGVMMAFSAEPMMSALLGLLILTPYTLKITTLTDNVDFWILSWSVFYLMWNMLQVNRMHSKLLKIQHSEQLVHFQEGRLREFINSLPGYVSWFDNELNYLDANAKLIELNHLSREELIGKNLGFTGAKDDLIQKIREFKNSNRAQSIEEITIVRDDGTKHFLTTMLRYRKDAAEEQISVLSLDVTPFKTKEIELEKRRLQLMTQEKFTALGEMAGGIAHEINNPLAIICGKADLLMMQKNRGLLSDENLDKQLKGIASTAQRIIRIVRSLKTLVRDGRIDNIEEITIAAAVEPLLDILYTRLENLGVTLTIEKEGLETKMRCGSIELGQVLMNLIINSAQAVEPLEEKWVKIHVQTTDSKVRIVVTDSGSGISDEVQRKLFQPFFTTKAPGVGTGIGLSLSRELMQKQQGDLFYESGNAHTTFVLELPRAQAQTADVPTLRAS
jgi:PAS domain S-box-containing protein